MLEATDRGDHGNAIPLVMTWALGKGPKHKSSLAAIWVAYQPFYVVFLLLWVPKISPSTVSRKTAYTENMNNTFY